MIGHTGPKHVKGSSLTKPSPFLLHSSPVLPRLPPPPPHILPPPPTPEMAEPPQQPSSGPTTPPHENNQSTKTNSKKNRGTKKSKRAVASSLGPSTMVEDPFFVLAGGKEGGFLELEEIDEADFGIVGGDVEDVGADEGKAGKDRVKKKNKKKRKRGGGDEGLSGDGHSIIENEQEEEEKEKKKAKRKRNRKKRKVKDGEKCGESDEDIADDNAEDMQDENENMEQDKDDELILGEDDVFAWNELRLHPLLLKAIRRLGFKEPTPIQKSCFPAAAHQGKDVIGAAETGSGKTLAFGLPILQRLLEEREKAARLQQEDEKMEESFKGSPLRALILTPTRELAKQVCDHLKEAAKFLGIHVVPIVGGLSMEKQERLLKMKPEIVVATPGRLWELISMNNQHLVELHSLSFFVLDEADRMIERGHFHELQSIIEMLPLTNGSDEQVARTMPNCETVPILQIKKRQTFVFSATLALSSNFRKKLKRGLSTSKASTDDVSSIEALSKQAGMKPNAEIVDLTKASILPEKLEESFIECSEEDKDSYLYYILSVHGQGRTIIFCTSIAALRHISSMLRILGINVLTNHAQMQQRARMKAVDRFRGSENSILVATDGFARGMDFDDVRTVIHYQLPHSTDVYIHRSGRTARKSLAGCSIALISPSDKSKFYSLCKSLSKENANKSWLQRNAESMGLILETSDSEEERVKGHKQRKATSAHLQKLQQELSDLLQRPLQPKTFSRRYLAGAGISPLLQKQLEELAKRNVSNKSNNSNKTENKWSRFVVIGQDRVEPLQALQNSGQEVCVNLEKQREKRRVAQNWKRKKHEEKKRNLTSFLFGNTFLFIYIMLGNTFVWVTCTREQKRKERRKAKEMN
ncbi:DEAD-box ATP-dependent RNA helicase 13 [Dichanthelium oligosanthes]|uniref:ATP-dependent RNA helicase n=1 Tax=Dichanthelium oligosanthes TaxID=888268 RepID=A0A1E5VR50_9POAL|nr:DEAD-box ATP-dependent RNA helicase 13 [Dichanthelium oligosanthes]